MKNSPHHIKHQVKKSLREANRTPRQAHLPLEIDPQPYFLKDFVLDHLKPIDIQKSKKILNDYKKHLEHARFIKGPHASKRTTPGEIEAKKGSLERDPQNPEKIIKHWNQSIQAKNKDVKRKLNKVRNPKKLA